MSLPAENRQNEKVIRRCHACNREFDEQVTFCPFDGQALTISTLLDGKYQLDEKIGEGGMGQVYRATHVHIGSTFAVKVLNPALVSDQIALQRFQREARAAAQIQHPNAVIVTDFGVSKESGIVYLVMEFLNGESLKDRIKREGQLDYLDCAFILRQTCAAVFAAHCKGIIHRDLKPDNISIVKDEDGTERVKVLDFGIAKLKKFDAKTLTEEGMILGTPYYMSPEQCSSEELDARSDVYSLGICLYQMLTGEVPFNAPTPMAVLMMHAGEKPRPLRALRPDIPQAVEDVVLRSLEKDKELRQQSAIELAHEFEMALYSAGIGDMPSNTPVGLTTFEKHLRSRKGRNAEGSGKDVVGTQQLPLAAPSGDNTVALFNDSLLVKSERSTQKWILASMASLIAVGLILGTIWWKVHVPLMNSSTVGMVLVPGGRFIMGNDRSDDESEKPEHEVAVEPFYMDEHEVTNEDYYRFIKGTNHKAPPGWIGGKFPVDKAKYPVVNIDWSDAHAYARWAGKRLPTEQEWEYAARGMDSRLYPWGNNYDPKVLNSAESKIDGPMPIGSYREAASPFGVLDMAGNVAEWTASDYQRYPGSRANLEQGKIVRGGSYSLDKIFAMTTTRVSVPPDTRKEYIGFRCVKSASSQQGR